VANNARAQLRTKLAGRFKSSPAHTARLVDERQPKRPASAYALFVTERFATGDFKGILVREAGKIIGAEWKSLSASEKKVGGAATSCRDLSDKVTEIRGYICSVYIRICARKGREGNLDRGLKKGLKRVSSKSCRRFSSRVIHRKMVRFAFRSFQDAQTDISPLTGTAGLGGRLGKCLYKPVKYCACSLSSSHEFSCYDVPQVTDYVDVKLVQVRCRIKSG
jgi:hypothetical protein